MIRDLLHFPLLLGITNLWSRIWLDKHIVRCVRHTVINPFYVLTTTLKDATSATSAVSAFVTSVATITKHFIVDACVVVEIVVWKWGKPLLIDMIAQLLLSHLRQYYVRLETTSIHYLLRQLNRSIADRKQREQEPVTQHHRFPLMAKNQLK